MVVVVVVVFVVVFVVVVFVVVVVVAVVGLVVVIDELEKPFPTRIQFLRYNFSEVVTFPRQN